MSWVWEIKLNWQFIVDYCFCLPSKVQCFIFVNFKRRNNIKFNVWRVQVFRNQIKKLQVFNYYFDFPNWAYFWNEGILGRESKFGFQYHLHAFWWFRFIKANRVVFLILGYNLYRTIFTVCNCFLVWLINFYQINWIFNICLIFRSRIIQLIFF